MTKAFLWTFTLLMVVSASTALRAGPTQYRLDLLPVPTGCESYSVLHGLDQSGTAVGILFCPA